MPFNWKQAHHLYIGIFFIVWGIFETGFWHYAFLLFGFHLFCDDLGQEIIKLKKPDYRSPINIFFRYLWHLGFGDWWPFGDL